MYLDIEVVMAEKRGNGNDTEPSVMATLGNHKWKNFQDAYRVAVFRQGNPQTYDGEPPSNKVESWVCQVKAVLEASKFEPESWVPVAAIQLQGVAAVWWGKTELDPWQLSWIAFMD